VFVAGALPQTLLRELTTLPRPIAGIHGREKGEGLWRGKEGGKGYEGREEGGEGKGKGRNRRGRGDEG